MNTVTPTTTPTEGDTQAHDDTARAVYEAMRALTGPHGVWPAGVFPVGATLMPFAWCDWEDLGLCGNDHIRRTALCYGLAAAAEGAVLARLSTALDRQAAHADDLGRVAYEALVAYDQAEGIVRDPDYADDYEPYDALDEPERALMAHTAAAVEQAVLARLSAALDQQAARAVDAPGRIDTYGRLIDALVEIARAMGVERVGGVRVAEHDADDDASGEDGTWERDV